MFKTWVISDTHFHHQKLTEWCGRPDTFTEDTINNWRKLVHPNDLVYHLGDIGSTNKKNCAGVLSQLPGQKILIRGNHDRWPIRWYLNQGFIAVMDSATIYTYYTKGKKNPRLHYYKVLLSHKPIPVPSEVQFNVHGHFHNNSSNRWEEDLKDVLTSKHRLLSLEETNYRPVNLGYMLYHDRLIKTLERHKK
jgi:calcineurin-like phosphoesterase family protein